MKEWWEINSMKCSCDFDFIPTTSVAGAVRPLVETAAVEPGRLLDLPGSCLRHCWEGRSPVWDSLTHRQDMIPMPRCYFTNDDSCGTTMICSCNSPEHADAGDCDCQSTMYHITVIFRTYPTSAWMTAT
uniref:Uncharacterized protein n=1 Tax=Oryza punctata TaxID=4537 RepID=A0A0E0M5D0_ORYPU